MNLPDEPLKISPSRIKVYHTCPKQHYYKYVLNLDKPSGPVNRYDKGNYTHELLHVYYRYIKEGVPIGSATAWKLMQTRIQGDLERNFTPDRLQFFNTILLQIEEYVLRRSPEIDKDMEVLGVEEEINVPVELPSGRIILLHGYLDLRYRKNGIVRIRDHKTDASNSAPDRSVFAYGGVDLSNQLLHYGAAIYAGTGEVSRVEISLIKTNDVKKTRKDGFGLYSAVHTAEEYEIYLEQTCKLIDQMLHSEALPHYDETVCKYCPFRTPCVGERMGIPSDRILASNYVPRSKPSERSAPQQDSDDDETHSFSLD